MKITMEQVRKYYLEERLELYWATREQIYTLCDDMGTDQPLMHWEMCKDEMACMVDDYIKYEMVE